jgi:hypothetical protein
MGLLQLLTYNLFTGEKGADPVIHGNIAINTLSACSTSSLLRDQIYINSPSSRHVLRPSRTVLRDRLQYLYTMERYNFFIRRLDLLVPAKKARLHVEAATSHKIDIINRLALKVSSGYQSCIAGPAPCTLQYDSRPCLSHPSRYAPAPMPTLGVVVGVATAPHVGGCAPHWRSAHPRSHVRVAGPGRGL